APGDYVEIEVPNFSASKLALLLYGIPLAVFIATLLFMIGLDFSELLSLLTAFSSMAVFYIGLSIYDRKNREKLMPIIIRKVSIKDVFTTIK
ncbi:MAG TPA: Fis family transcriptional regulator, partial [Kosmotoga arenicorallina]|nr:Fis family transcriptional regulator [Kosmotoga arenicorallina]